jgi:hypothetical protein
MAQVLTGTSNFFPGFADLIVEAYSRIQIRPNALTVAHMLDARMSANLMQSEWSVKSSAPNLWKVQLFSIPLVQGISTYSVPTNVIGILDYYLRTFQLNTAVNLPANAFTTTLNSTSVQVNQPNHGLIPGNWAGFPVQVSVGGLIIYGFYQVTTVIDQNNFTITAAAAATSGATGGVVPQFTTTLNSTSVTVRLPNHGMYANQNFTVAVPTAVGGVTISGPYPIVAVVDANNFTITVQSPAGAAASAYENAGAPQIQPQNTSTNPIDFVLFPISRTEYAEQPNKFKQARPTTIWWDRTINSTGTLWQTPDGAQPYVLYYYAFVQQQDLATGGYAPDVPFRFLEAFAAGLAAKLAVKYPPPPPNTTEKMDTLAERSWKWAANQDVEDVPMFITPGLTGYYR